MTGYQSKRAAAQDKMAHLTLEQRCRLSEQCLPDAPYRAMLTKMHDEMLKALAQPEQKPVAFISPGGHIHYDPYLDSVPLYTTPPQRKPLTDEEIHSVRDSFGEDPVMLVAFARAVEAAIKDNNT